MEGKTTRTEVLAACLLVLLLSGQPAPVSGSIMSKYKDKYYTCFWKCYTPCRNNDHQPRPVCKIRCQGKCLIPYGVPAASAAALAGGGDGACREICIASVGCSTAAAAAATGGDRGPTNADVAACVDGCNVYCGRMNAKPRLGTADREVDARTVTTRNCCDACLQCPLEK